jgi:glycosyltransferase involved in cell wall biosynthesis
VSRVDDAGRDAAVREPWADGLKVCVTSRGNEFMIDIARSFVAGFAGAGVPSVLAIDAASFRDDGRVALVVAPHEFFPLYLDQTLGRPAAARFRRSALVLNVEQPGSQWFERAVDLARTARAVLDIHESGVRELRRRGVATVHAPLGYVDDLRAPGRARDVDLLFMGVITPRRAAFFARFAELFAGYRCQFLFARLDEPRTADTAGYVSGPERLALLARSRILLNVHAADSSYFESHRALLAASNGCVLVSEWGAGSDPFRADVHLVMADVSELAARCVSLLDDEPRRAALADEALAIVTRSLRMEAICARVLGELGAPAPRPAVLGPSPPPLAPDADREALRARLATAVAARQNGHPDYDVVSNRAHARGGDVAVSVVVPLFNYGRYVEECLRSVEVAEKPAPGIELVVVDDGSRDDSRAQVERFMESTSLPTTLVRKQSNTGLADTRNIGWHHARAPYVFFLDADNRIHPPCLRVLHEAAVASGSAAAYGIIRTFDDATGEPRGLLSAYAWSARDLVAGPYLDAMALFDRAALTAVGGYSTELLEFGWQGWEDYDLWLKLAQDGHVGVRVPQILSSYRVHDASMIRRTNQDTARIAAHFARKFARLADSFPDLDRHFGFPRPGRAFVHAGAFTGADLESHCRALEAELQTVYASRSWTVTAPMRAAFDFLVGRRRPAPPSR